MRRGPAKMQGRAALFWWAPWGRRCVPGAAVVGGAGVGASGGSIFRKEEGEGPAGSGVVARVGWFSGAGRFCKLFCKVLTGQGFVVNSWVRISVREIRDPCHARHLRRAVMR